ncbi:MAG TPA: hypothetical protein VFF73_34685, partial [Planctomycetota bacterium]|nr:hypothetical protein [Planctomycetota bacterium]
MRIDAPSTESTAEARAPVPSDLEDTDVPPAPCAPGAGPWVVAATVLGSGMTFLDGTVVNAALPVLQSRLG